MALSRIADTDQFIDHDLALSPFDRGELDRSGDDAVRHGVVDTVADANCRLEDFIDAFQSGRNVHAITHHRVAQALGGADIAHDDIGAMQANAHAHLRTTIPSPLKVQPTDA